MGHTSRWMSGGTWNQRLVGSICVAWAMSARYPSNFQIDEIVHEDDQGIDHVVPACATLVGGGPTVADPLCWDTFQTGQQAPGNLKLVTASGRALENGKIGFG